MAELEGPAPVAKAGRYSGTDTGYKTLASWTCGKVWGGKRSELHQIRIVCTDYAHPRFRLNVKKTLMFEDQKLEAALVIPFPKNDVLRMDDEILLEVKSDDGTSITCFGIITGSETP